MPPREERYGLRPQSIPSGMCSTLGQGDAYTDPAPKTTDAVMALDMASGKVVWSVQDTQDDAWLSGCGGGGADNPNGISENCPKPLGPDFDFGASMILRTLPDGHRVLVAPQKSGMVWAHDPDQQGKLLWKAQLVDKLALGMITFGGAADDQNAYFGLRSGGIAAVSLKTGEKKWFTPLPGQHPGAPQSRANGGADGHPGRGLLGRMGRYSARLLDPKRTRDLGDQYRA